eukprot:scaffold33233_cov31-Tisochrysis_lutea.AAC.3
MGPGAARRPGGEGAHLKPSWLHTEYVSQALTIFKLFGYAPSTLVPSLQCCRRSAGDRHSSGANNLMRRFCSDIAGTEFACAEAPTIPDATRGRCIDMLDAGKSTKTVAPSLACSSPMSNWASGSSM